MDKAHDVKNLSFSGSFLRLDVDGTRYEINLAEISDRLANATHAERENVEVSPAGYGLHWPDVDEDLAIDGLIGVKHAPPHLRK